MHRLPISLQALSEAPDNWKSALQQPVGGLFSFMPNYKTTPPYDESGYACQLLLQIGTPLGLPGDILCVKEVHYRFGHWERVRQPMMGPLFEFVIDSDEILYCDNAPEKYLTSNPLDADASCDLIEEWTTPNWYKRPALYGNIQHVRIFLEVQKVFPQRLTDISYVDCCRHGIGFKAGKFYNYTENTFGFKSARQSFVTLWDYLYSRGAYASDPWVFATSFKRVERPRPQEQPELEKIEPA